MAACNASPTLTLFQTVTSTTIITTSTVVPQTQPNGIVATVTLPLIITSIITLVNPTSTLYASCPSVTAPITITSFPQPSPTPTTITITTTPLPTVVTALQTSSLDNGVISVFTITSTSTPPVALITSTTVVSQSQTSKSSSNIVPIAGGVVGGFIFLIGAVALAWFIWKKCRKPTGVTAEEEDVVFPYPVTRDRDQGRRLDLTKESRPYEHGLVGRSTQMRAPGSSPAESHDGRPDSSAPLIGASSVGLTPMASASATMYGAQTRVGEVGRQASQISHGLPVGAAPPDRYSHSGGSVTSASSSVGPTSPNRRPLQVINSPPSPMPTLPGPSSGAMLGSSSTPYAGHDEKQSAWSGKTHTRNASSLSGAILSNDGHSQGHDDRPSGSGPVVPEPITGEPTDAPPAYVA